MARFKDYMMEQQDRWEREEKMEDRVMLVISIIALVVWCLDMFIWRA